MVATHELMDYLGRGVHATAAWRNNRRTVGRGVSVPSLLGCYKQDKSRIWLAVGQLPTVKNVSKEAEVIVGIRHQVTTGEATADWEDLEL
jgi:hypothetical protein